MLGTSAMVGTPFVRQGQPLRIEAAYTPQYNEVLVTFSRPVKMTTEITGALNLYNYVIEGLTLLSVARESDQQVLLATSTQRVSIPYTLTVDNVEDLSGNPICPA